ncbi:MAG: hypothetical protein DRO12_05615 [Thermoprotei archaeon]|nr:MAG: hypothetical protein DRO12_05615 [Thermoprotei archaeon]
MKIAHKLERFIERLHECRSIKLTVHFLSRTNSCNLTHLFGRCQLTISMSSKHALRDVAASCSSTGVLTLIRVLALSAVAVLGVLSFYWELPSAALGFFLSLAAIIEGLVGRIRRGSIKSENLTSYDEYVVENVEEMLRNLLKIIEDEKHRGSIDLANGMWSYELKRKKNSVEIVLKRM